MSRPIRADQLVYTNVSAGYSPAGQRGYQTVCASRGLSQGDCREIEQQVGGLPEANADAVRWQCFRLAQDRWVLTRSQRVPPDGEISDPRGAFLAHAVVISAVDFAASRYDAIALIDGVAFVRSPREMVDRFGAANGVAPAVDLTVNPTLPSSEGWAGPALLELAGLAAGAEGLAREGRSLLILGEPHEVEATLRLALWLAPPAWRKHCTFDTMAVLSAVRPGQFWAVGIAGRRPEREGYVPVDAGQRGIPGSAKLPESSRPSIYARWLEASLGGNPELIAGCVRLAPAMQALDHALETGEPLADDVELGPEVCAGFERYVGGQVQSLLIKRLSGATCVEVGAALGAWLDERLTADSRLGLALGRIPASEHAAALCFQWLLAAQPELSAAASERLLEVARQRQHAGLALLASLWQRKPDLRTRDTALAEIEAGDFSQVLTLCPQRIVPTHLVCRPHAGLLLERLGTVATEEGELTECLAALVRVGHRGPFAPVLSQVATLGLRSLRFLLRLPGRPWRGDPAFLKALIEQYRIVKAAQPWWKRPLPWPRRPRAGAGTPVE
ncbi:MAG: hypothetical protein FJ387_15555 [Verrucomicrobia bacterium]|nr:hypothetical protein [Verrucomicrobiota bacterium]